MISVVTPAFNEPGNFEALYDRLSTQGAAQSRGRVARLQAVRHSVGEHIW